MIDWATRELRDALRPVPRRRKIERQRYVIRHALGPFPAGTECWLSRARPDAMAVFEFDDGSVGEVGWGYTGVELEPSFFSRLLGKLFGAREVPEVPDLLFAHIARWIEDA